MSPKYSILDSSLRVNRHIWWSGNTEDFHAPIFPNCCTLYGYILSQSRHHNFIYCLPFLDKFWHSNTATTSITAGGHLPQPAVVCHNQLMSTETLNTCHGQLSANYRSISPETKIHSLFTIIVTYNHICVHTCKLFCAATVVAVYVQMLVRCQYSGHVG